MRMYTSIVLFALAGAVVPAADAPASPRWETDYVAARKKGQREEKPVAIFCGKGDEGWNALGSDGPLDREALRLLEEKYVPLYLDLGTDAARKLADALKVKAAPTLVLTDRSGDQVALRYAGTLDGGDLRRCLLKYADPNRVVRQTDTDPNLEVRYYPPAAAEEGPRTYQEARALAQKAGRPLLLVFQGPECPLCRKMERETFADAGLRVALNKHVVYFVRTDREPAVTRYYLPPPGALPAYCLVNPKDQTVRKNGSGLKPPDEFLAWLE
jgi:thioredoxin-related protein